jgi:two-component system, LytTR family, sensor histidine kinase AgrC
MFLYSLFISILNVLSVHTLLIKKKPVWYCILAFLLNTLLIYLLVFIIKKNFGDSGFEKYALTFTAFMNILYICLVFQESFPKKLFTMFSIWIFSLIIFYFSIPVSKSLSPLIGEQYLQDLSYFFRFLVQILFIVISYLRLHIKYKRILDSVSNKTITFMSMYLIMAFILLIYRYEISFTAYTNYDFVYEMFLNLILIIWGYVIVFTGVSSSSRIISLLYDYKTIENQVELQRQNYSTLNESLTQLYSLKHDERHHINAIESMVKQQNYKEVLEYIEQYNRNDMSTTIPALCNNFVADSIIKHYMGIANRKKIDFKTDLIIPENIGINSLDLCIVLGNSLENAIEACDRLTDSQDKYIKLISKIVGTHIIFQITNNFCGDIMTADNILKSSKGGLSHGIGLTNIRETANKYNGNLEIKYSNQTFEITIIMCTSN